MAKETETEETISFFAKFLSLVTFQLRRGGGGAGLSGSPFWLRLRSQKPH